jgi:Fe-S cluster biosynthesis and repair protein YggX
MNADARKFLAEKREVFLFQPGELAMPSAYTPPVPKFD